MLDEMRGMGPINGTSDTLKIPEIGRRVSCDYTPISPNINNIDRCNVHLNK